MTEFPVLADHWMKDERKRKDIQMIRSYQGARKKIECDSDTNYTWGPFYLLLKPW